MFVWWFAALAMSAMPSHVDLNDLDHWEALADRVLEGPPGCWEIVGKASWNWDGGRFGGTRGDQVFVARLVDGVWQEFRIEALGEVQRERRGAESRVYVEESARFVPLVGRLDGYRPQVADSGRQTAVAEEEKTEREQAQEEREQARRDRQRDRRRERRGDSAQDGPRNMLTRFIDRLTGSVVSSWAQWDGERDEVVLYRQFPIQETRLDAEQTIRFPDGGAPVALDLAFPERFTARDGIWSMTVRDAEVKVRVRPSGGMLFPTMEAYKFNWTFLGFSGSGAQTITYRSARPCPATGVSDAPESAG